MPDQAEILNRMKKFFILFFVGFCINSCNDIQNKKSANNDNSLLENQFSNNIKINYSQNIDTFYKKNSTKIDRIVRTFFIAGDTFKITDQEKTYKITHNNFIRLSKKLGEDEYSIWITKDEEKVSVFEYFSERELKKFFADADTIFHNPGKSLTYTFGRNGLMDLVGDKVSIFITNDYRGKDQYTSKGLTKAEFDSMKNCFLRFKAEK